MRSNYACTFVVATVAVLGGAASAAAQDRTADLNTVELRQLINRGAPADEARLSAHFSALADRYTAEAARHTAMARTSAGNPNRATSSGMRAHCERLADLNTQSATTARELAAFHTQRANGVTAPVPANAAPFHAGAGTREPTADELNGLAESANTPAEHHALETYFRSLAQRYDADAKQHTALAAAIRGTRIEQAAPIHTHLATLARDAAKEATAAADMHKLLAKDR